MKTGFELEFTAAIKDAESPEQGRFYNYVMMLMEEAGVHSWRLDDDASCGNELVSPPLEEDVGLAQAIQVCNCVQTAKEVFKLDRVIGVDCGVHFHFDATDLVKESSRSVKGIKNILLLSAILEPLWYSMNPGSRLDAAFAAPLNFNMFQMIRARDMTDIRDIWFRPYMGVSGNSDSYRIKNNNYLPRFINDDKCQPEKYDWTRYHGFNLVALFKHGTFEFRYTHGSFDVDNITLWFKMYRDVVIAARKMRTQDIVKCCPVNISSIKMNCIDGLQSSMYSDLKLGIQFLFSIIPEDVRLLKFILYKLIKYNRHIFPSNIARSIFDYSGDFNGLMSLIKNMQMVGSHYNRFGRLKSIMSNPFANDPPAAIEEDNEYVEPSFDETQDNDDY